MSESGGRPGPKVLATGPVRVVLAADDVFAMPMAVTGRSVIANLPAERSLELWIFDAGISGESRERLARTFDDPRTTVHWIDIVRHVAGLPTLDRISVATYGRLVISELLEGARALYLDCDLIVRCSVADLYDADLETHVALAVRCQAAPFVSCPWGVPGWFELGLDPAAPYFNCGVLLLNLEVWRNEQVARDLLEYLRSDRYFTLADQEALNTVVGRRIGELDPRWNAQCEIYERVSELAQPYASELVAELFHRPWIVHFDVPTKPWHHGCDNPWVGEWMGYLDQTAWAGWRPPGPTPLQRLARPARRLARRLGVA